MRTRRLAATAPRLAVVLLAAAGLACARQGKEATGAGSKSAVLLPVPDDPTVSFKIWFQVGSQADPKGKEGLAYVTGHLLAEGSTTKNPYEAILAKLYPLASSYDVRVDREMTTFGGRTHRDNLEKFNELLTDALLHPAFSTADFERVRSDALNEIEKNLRYASDEDLGKATFMEMVFAGTPYEHPEVGTAQGLKAITLEDVKNFYLSHYTRGNLVVGLGGGYPEDLPARLTTALHALPAGAPAATPASVPAPLHGRQVVLVSKPGANASISFGAPIDVHRGQREFYALWLANSWLGEHRNSSSHLYQVIRSDRGLNYGDYSYIEAYPEGGQRNKPPTNVGRREQCFEVWIRTLPNDQAVFALRAALHEVQGLVEHGMTPEEFELTRSFLDKYVLHFAETTTDRLGYAIDDRFYGLPGSHLQDFRRILHELTLEEVNAAIRKHLQVENLKIAIVTGEADKLQQQLTADAPTPIQYKSKMPDAVQQEDVAIASVPLRLNAAEVQVVPVEKMFEN